MRRVAVATGVLVAACSCGSEATPEPQPLAPVTATEPWVPYTDMPECQHVKVEMDCEAGWCTIPAGCFVMGSPETEWGRGINNEHQRTAILSRSFELMQHVVPGAPSRPVSRRGGWGDGAMGMVVALA